MWERFKNYYHLLKAIIANCLFGFPSRSIKVIGVTGTNGKTTTTQLIAAVLRQAGFRVAVSSTVNFTIDQKKWINKSKFTTPDAYSLQKFIRQAVSAKCDYLVAEVSSHALEQNRVWGVKFWISVLTNITREHLDYHKNMANYRKSKKRLFLNTAKNGGWGVFNQSLTDLTGFIPKDLINRALVYGLNRSNFPKSISVANRISGVIQKATGEKTDFLAMDHSFSLNLRGDFNVENALAVLAVARILNISLAKVAKAFREFPGVPGRLESVPNQKGFNIIIDYALTPDSMTKIGQLLTNQKTNPPKHLIWVFGACGDRDRGKRPIMGRIASSFADYLILTNEDPYTEDPARIVGEIMTGITTSSNPRKDFFVAGKNLFVIMDRKEAIKRALSLAESGDTVLLTGKGAEENIKIGHSLYPWNEKKVVLELLKEMAPSKSKKIKTVK